jgi:hypothetical protein
VNFCFIIENKISPKLQCAYNRFSFCSSDKKKMCLYTSPRELLPDSGGVFFSVCFHSWLTEKDVVLFVRFQTTLYDAIQQLLLRSWCDCGCEYDKDINWELKRIQQGQLAFSIQPTGKKKKVIGIPVFNKEDQPLHTSDWKQAWKLGFASSKTSGLVELHKKSVSESCKQILF